MGADFILPIRVAETQTVKLVQRRRHREAAEFLPELHVLAARFDLGVRLLLLRAVRAELARRGYSPAEAPT